MSDNTRLITNYADWNKINEQEGKTVSKAGGKGLFKLDKQRVIVTPKGDFEFKLLVDDDKAIVNDKNEMTQDGWDSLKRWMANQTNLAKYVALLNDPNKYKAVYSVITNKGVKTREEAGSEGTLVTDLQKIDFKIVPAETYKGLTLPYISKGKAELFNKNSGTILKDETTGGNTTDDKTTADKAAADKAAADKAAADKTASDKAAATSDTSLLTKDKLPIKYKDRGDHVKQYQDLVINKVKGTKLFNTAPFVRFNKYGSDGIYGNNTKEVTRILKDGFNLGDHDGTIVTTALIDSLKNDKITESYLWYGRIVEAFNMQAALDSAAQVEKEHVSNKKEAKPSAKTGSKPADKPEAKPATSVAKKEVIDDVEDSDISRKIRLSIKGINTDEDALIAAIQRIKNPNQLTRIINLYTKNYKENLINAINDDLNNDRESDGNVITTINRHLQKIGAKSRVTGS
jgi:hypothetical protein